MIAKYGFSIQKRLSTRNITFALRDGIPYFYWFDRSVGLNCLNLKPV